MKLYGGSQMEIWFQEEKIAIKFVIIKEGFVHVCFILFILASPRALQDLSLQTKDPTWQWKPWVLVTTGPPENSLFMYIIFK